MLPIKISEKICGHPPIFRYPNVPTPKFHPIQTPKAFAAVVAPSAPAVGAPRAGAAGRGARRARLAVASSRADGDERRPQPRWSWSTFSIFFMLMMFQASHHGWTWTTWTPWTPWSTRTTWTRSTWTTRSAWTTRSTWTTRSARTTGSAWTTRSWTHAHPQMCCCRWSQGRNKNTPSLRAGHPWMHVIGPEASQAGPEKIVKYLCFNSDGLIFWGKKHNSIHWLIIVFFLIAILWGHSILRYSQISDCWYSFILYIPLDPMKYIEIWYPRCLLIFNLAIFFPLYPHDIPWYCPIHVDIQSQDIPQANSH